MDRLFLLRTLRLAQRGVTILAWFAVKLLSVDGASLVFYRSTFPLQSALRLVYNSLNACYPVAEESKGVVSARLIFMPRCPLILNLW